MRIYLKNNQAKFHPDPIWNVGALGFFKSVELQQKEKQQEEDRISFWSKSPEVVSDDVLTLLVKSSSVIVCQDYFDFELHSVMIQKERKYFSHVSVQLS